MISDWELWASADQVIKQHGDQALAFVAERIGALALAGDKAGIATWKAIGARIDQMSEHPGEPH